MQRRVNVRRRIIIASTFCSILLFVFTTPVIAGLRTLILPPPQLQNVRLFQSLEDVQISWNIPKESHITSVNLRINNRVEELPIDKTEFRISQSDTFVDNLQRAQIQVYSNDYVGRQSQPIVFDIERITETSPLKSYEETKGEESSINVGQNAFLLSAIISILLGFFGLWIFELKIRSVKETILIFYIGLVNYSYLFIGLSILFGAELPFSRFLFSVGISVLFYILSYLIYLTVNILYNSLSYELPLEQAAKASQFIFSLIAAYLLLIVMFSSDYRLLDKAIATAFFIGFYSLSSIAMLKNIHIKDAMWRSINITMVIMFAIFVISIWPVHYIYAILAIAVIYYILLSISLENRHTLTKYTWVEYGTLLTLVFALFVLTSNWGINGNLL